MTEKLEGKIDRESLVKIFEPFVRKDQAGDPSWDQMVDSLSGDLKKRKWKNRVLSVLWPSRLRNQKNIEENYSDQWSGISLENQLSTAGDGVPCEWGERKMFAVGHGIKRVYHELLFSLIGESQCQSILEVGTGNGINLIALSGMCSIERMVGVELTKGGVEAAKGLVARDEFPHELGSFLNVEIPHPENYRNIEFVQGNAKQLPFEDNEFDMVFSVLALEQMQEIKDFALKEMARVSKRFVLMIEPFSDFNQTPMRRSYIESMVYFDQKIGELRDMGMEVEGVYDDLPSKIRMGVGCVLAKPVSASDGVAESESNGDAG